MHHYLIGSSGYNAKFNYKKEPQPSKLSNGNMCFTSPCTFAHRHQLNAFINMPGLVNTSAQWTYKLHTDSSSFGTWGYVASPSLPSPLPPGLSGIVRNQVLASPTFILELQRYQCRVPVSKALGEFGHIFKKIS